MLAFIAMGTNFHLGDPAMLAYGLLWVNAHRPGQDDLVDTCQCHELKGEGYVSSTRYQAYPASWIYSH